MTARRMSLRGRWRMYDDRAAPLFLVYNKTLAALTLTLDCVSNTEQNDTSRLLDEAVHFFPGRSSLDF